VAYYPRQRLWLIRSGGLKTWRQGTSPWLAKTGRAWMSGWRLLNFCACCSLRLRSSYTVRGKSGLF